MSSLPIAFAVDRTDHALNSNQKMQADQFLVISDDAPEGMLGALDSTYPAASKVGLIGSSTPFITGRPFTLFDSKDYFSDGALGIATFRISTEDLQPSLSFPGIRQLSSARLTVTECAHCIEINTRRTC